MEDDPSETSRLHESNQSLQQSTNPYQSNSYTKSGDIVRTVFIAKTSARNSDSCIIPTVSSSLHGSIKSNSNSKESIAFNELEPLKFVDSEPVIVKCEQTERLKNLLCIILNVASAVGVVLSNKVVLSVYKFQFGTFLTVLHFVVTAIALEIMVHFGMFPAKRIAIGPIIPLSLSFCGFVVLTNLSLQYNSVGFYQMAKVLTTPCVATIQYLWYRTTFKPPVIATLLITCAGVMIATFTEVNLNLVGLSFALCAVLITSFYQVWVGAKQKELGINAMQLLFYQAPVSSAILTFFTPAFDSFVDMSQFPLTIPCFMAIVVSALMAVLVNVSTFLIIGRTSVITYNVVGHGKLVLILLFGYIFFDGHLSLSNVFGVILALGGIMTYSYLTLVTMANNK